MENNFKIVCSGFIKFFILVLLALLFLSIVYSVTYYDISHTGVISDSSLTCLEIFSCTFCCIILLYSFEKW